MLPGGEGGRNRGTAGGGKRAGEGREEIGVSFVGILRLGRRIDGWATAVEW